MAEESIEAKLARLEAENQALKQQVERKARRIALEGQRKGRAVDLRVGTISRDALQRAVDADCSTTPMRFASFSRPTTSS